jgi:putative GTP pyrophosphokinase
MVEIKDSIPPHENKENISLEQTVEQYKTIRPTYLQFEQKLKALIEELLNDIGIDYDLVESRTKTVDSFREKINRPGKQYINPIEEITDKVGIRIVLYYLSDIENVCELLRTEFKIDDSLSIDKGSELKPNEFGYRSIHKIIIIGPNRCGLPEWRSYIELKAEIQVRTVLQHAWASIDHALRYKNESDVPTKLRRRLFRLSGLLEMADEEFSALKDEQIKISDEATISIQRGEDLEINAQTIERYLENSDLVKKIVDCAIEIGFVTEIEDSNISNLIKTCNYFGIARLNGLNSGLLHFKDNYKSYLQKIYNKLYEIVKEKEVTINKSGIIEWFIYILNKEKVEQYLIDSALPKEGIQKFLKIFNSFI